MTRGGLIDCLEGKKGKPISIHHTGGTIMGIFEEFIWGSDALTITGVKLKNIDQPFKPENITEIRDAPMFTVTMDLMDKLRRD